MSAQFFSSLADNALLVGAIELPRTTHAPSWQVPALTPMFALFYVLLAPLVGAFADAVPKGRVMFVSNTIKVMGCVLMLFGGHPLWSYAVVGLGAAAYSPAKYGILTELLPPSQLVKANGWIEGLTIASIILGVLLGGQLVGGRVAPWLLTFDFPFIDTGVDTPPEAAISSIVVLYVIAAVFNLYIPRTDAPLQPLNGNVISPGGRLQPMQRALVGRQAGADLVGHDDALLGRQATLRVIVFAWPLPHWDTGTTQASSLVGVVAIGTAAGAILASWLMRLELATRRHSVGRGDGRADHRPEHHPRAVGGGAVLYPARCDRRLFGGAEKRCCNTVATT